MTNAQRGLKNYTLNSMTHQIKKGSINNHQDNETSNIGDFTELNGLQEEKTEQKVEIIINGKDLELVQKQCHLSRQEAIDLIQKCNGDIKETLKTYINQ